MQYGSRGGLLYNFYHKNLVIVITQAQDSKKMGQSASVDIVLKPGIGISKEVKYMTICISNFVK